MGYREARDTLNKAWRGRGFWQVVAAENYFPCVSKADPIGYRESIKYQVSGISIDFSVWPGIRYREKTIQDQRVAECPSCGLTGSEDGPLRPAGCSVRENQAGEEGGGRGGYDGLFGPSRETT